MQIAFTISQNDDRNTQMPFIEKLEKKYGKIGNLWLMDRGVPSEETLQAMREGGYRYLVGAPRGHLKNSVADKITRISTAHFASL